MNLNNKQIIVLGAGSSGRAAAALAQREGASVSVHDSADCIEGLAAGVSSVTGSSTTTGEQSHCDILVLSPGIDGHGAFAQSYAQNAGEVIGELELASQFYTGKVIAITGTNGKTTTTEIIDAMLNAAGMSCLPCGNHGMPLSELVLMENPPQVAALEVSSFQLETIKNFRPDVAVWLNFSADHMDRYPTLDAYKAAKLRVFENMTADQTIVTRAGEDLRGAHHADINLLSFSTESEADFILAGQQISAAGEAVIDLSPTRIRGLHNAENVMAAYAACSLLGVSAEVANKALASFSPPAHRCELIAEVDGVEYINDSKATNLHALDSALRSQSRPIVLIAGGKEKGLEYADLLERLSTTTKAVVVFGEIADKLMDTLGSIKDQVNCQKASDLEEATTLARGLASAGDVVLFSPGTSSFDMYAGYEARGDHFRQIIHQF